MTVDYEKLGSFYLGKRREDSGDELTDELVLYDSKDLTTHAVIIGMTGSGKTGLGIGLLEEAAIDKVPVIAIDPKGDMGNLLLTFPDLAPQDFRPWINERAAEDKGRTPDEYAADQAALWKGGLESWGQDGKRIQRFRDSVDLAIYTPGSTAGLPVSVLQSFNAPPDALLEDTDLYTERLQATATGILTLLDIDADPVSSREHILIATLLDHAWREGRSLDIASLIAEIQKPPVQKIGVMSVNAFFPEKDRFALAMKLNNLLAAPGFQSWLDGTPLDCKSLLYTAEGKPRISVMSIAHLDDNQRMFFVSMLLSELIGWMRAQSGTSSLRAILYMDEMFGYMPPVANPPSKNLFLTLLKQARAYGLGLVLSTQNPVDLDYKGLSNTGTWFIGRLQTERDKARVMEGLEGASDSGFDKQAMEQTLAGLGKRRFLLHSVHESKAVVFGTRWVMSYLAGPLTRTHIKSLMKGHKHETDVPAEKPVASAPSATAPALPPAVEQLFAPADDGAAYVPRLYATADLAFSSVRYKVESERQVSFLWALDDGPVEVDWDAAEPTDLAAGDLEPSAVDGATFDEPPACAGVVKNYSSWTTAFKRWVRQNETVTIWRYTPLKLMSTDGESEGDFRARLQHAAKEQRDEAVETLRKRYSSKVTTLENRLLRAEQALEREEQQLSGQRRDSLMSLGADLLGAVLGRKRISSTTAKRMGKALGGAAGGKERGDVERAEETVEKVKSDLAALNAECEAEIAALDTGFDAQSVELEELVVRAKTTDINVPLVALVWIPTK